MLRTHLPEPRYLLTAALPINPRCLENISLSRAGYVLDYLNLRAYDNTGPWSSAVGHPAQLLPPPFNSAPTPEPQLSCHLGVDYLVSHGFPRHKIVVGVSTFARCFPGAAGLGCPFVKDKCTDLKYCDLPDKWIANATIDEEVGAASFVDWREDHPCFCRSTCLLLYVRRPVMPSLWVWPVCFIGASWETFTGQRALLLLVKRGWMNCSMYVIQYWSTYLLTEVHLSRG